ncbi:putative phage integrase [Variovorax paradoxus B4]|uniref:Putative phage integrase n=1 Tax=Variovorax paradoxus B4 TaxID=1246301 RepID=T1XH03_VARPD|nr:putative phage integrase [Variovorax paradoxus B4]
MDRGHRSLYSAFRRRCSWLWKGKTETASRLRGRIEAVLAWATVSRRRAGDNPARWKGFLDQLLAAPADVKEVQHHPALPYGEMPSFCFDLQTLDGDAAQLFLFLIFTAARIGEARAAMWTAAAHRRREKAAHECGADHGPPVAAQARPARVAVSVDDIQALPRHHVEGRGGHPQRPSTGAAAGTRPVGDPDGRKHRAGAGLVDRAGGYWSPGRYV